MMEQPADNHNNQVEEAENKPTVSLGTMLREARERMGMSINEVANQIKFAPRQIEALEADNFGEKPEAAFLRGFVRSYGKLLHLDEGALFAALPEIKATTLSAAPEPERMSYPNTQAMQKKQNLIFLGLALLIVLVAIGFAFSGLNVSKTVQVSSVETPVALPITGDVAQQPETAASAVEAAVPVAEIPPQEIKAEAAVAAKTDKPVAEKNVVDKPIVEKPTVAKPLVDKPIAPKPVELVAASDKKNKPEKAVAVSAQTPPAVTETAPAKEFIPIDTLLGIQPKSAIAPEESGNAASEMATVRIVFGEDSWTEVKDRSGKIISSQVNGSGSELHLKGNAPFTLSIGHARSARLYYKGRQVDLAPYIKKYSAVAHLTLE